MTSPIEQTVSTLWSNRSDRSYKRCYATVVDGKSNASVAGLVIYSIVKISDPKEEPEYHLGCIMRDPATIAIKSNGEEAQTFVTYHSLRNASKKDEIVEFLNTHLALPHQREAYKASAFMYPKSDAFASLQADIEQLHTKGYISDALKDEALHNLALLPEKAAQIQIENGKRTL